MIDRKDHVERRLAESFAPILWKQELRSEEQRKRGEAGGQHRAISCWAPGARLVRFSSAVARVDAESPLMRPPLSASTGAMASTCPAGVLHSTAEKIGQFPAVWRKLSSRPCPSQR